MSLAQAQHQGADPRVSAEECEWEKLGKEVREEEQKEKKNTNMTIQQIACELSFPNASSFGTFFKKHTGLSPKNYRMGAE